MKLPPRLAAVVLIAVASLAAAGCVRTKNPEGWARPVPTDQATYFFPSKGHLAAAKFDAAGGIATTLWSFPDSKAHADEKGISLKGTYTDPIVDGDLLYVSSYEEDVFAVVRSDGSLRWRIKQKPNGSIVGGPVLTGDRLIFGTTEGGLYAISKTDGSPAPGWPAGGVKVGGSGIWAPPVVVGDVVVIATMDGKVYGYKIADGTRAWTSPYEAAGAIADLALLDPTHLFVPALSHEVAILNPADGGNQVGPTFKAADWVWTEPALGTDSDGKKFAYFGDFSGTVYKLNIDTLEAKWKYDAGERVKATPALVQGILIVADRAAVVHFIDTGTGKALNTVPLLNVGTVRSGVGVDGTRGLIQTTQGKLYAADPAKLAVTAIDVRAAAP